VRHALQSIYQSVFFPESFAENSRALLCVLRFGWIFILTRWLYYSIVFTSLWDYHGAWKPFAGLPFGLDSRTYAALQRNLAVPFGLFVMAVMSVTIPPRNVPNMSPQPDKSVGSMFAGMSKTQRRF